MELIAGFEWRQVAMNDYKRLPLNLRMTTTGIGNNLRHKKVYLFLWLHKNERNKYIEKCCKNSCGMLLVKNVEKYLRCSRSQMFLKVSVLKKAFNSAILLKRDSKTRFSCEICEIFKNTSGGCIWLWQHHIL